MEKSIVEQFVTTCKENRDKPALIGKHGTVRYGQLLRDLYKTVGMFQSQGLKPGDRVMVLVPPSYEFYLVMLSGIYYGLNLVVMDSYKSLKNVKWVLRENDIRSVFCNPKTAPLKLLLTAVPFLNVEGFSRYEAREVFFDLPADPTVLTTFTSGTTGTPKPICRGLGDFKEQISVVSENVTVEPDAVVYSTLPIYVLFILFKGLTCIIDKSMSPTELQALGVTAILAPIAQLLQLKEPMSFVKSVSIGGAIVYPREAKKLLHLFPQAKITYVYGSSECVLMAKGDLRTYLETGALQRDIAGIDLCLVNADGNGVGQIRVSGNVVLSETKEYVSSDLARLSGNALTVVGRKEYSEEGRYNYLIDAELLEENPGVTKGFSIVREGNVYFCYEGKVSVHRGDVKYVKFSRLPMDAKHRTKLNYKKALKKI